MASFVIHHIVGLRVISLLEEYGIKLSKQQKTQFLLGNLIVDSSKLKLEIKEGEDKELAKKMYKKEVQKEKVFTHFRDKEDANLCIQSPVPEKFIAKYNNLLENDLSALGYLLHLYTDKSFFTELFPITFETLDDNLQPTIYLKEATNIRVTKDGKVYSTKEFWGKRGEGSIYDDYTIMNKILLQHFSVEFNKSDFIDEMGEFINPGIEEVDYANIIDVIKKTDMFIKESYQKIDSKLCVFTEEIVINFVDSVAKRFVQEHFEQLKSLGVKEGISRKLIHN